MGLKHITSSVSTFEHLFIIEGVAMTIVFVSQQNQISAVQEIRFSPQLSPTHCLYLSGLLQKVPQLYLKTSSAASYNFIHKTLQEFLTAWHVSSLPSLEQRAFVKDASSKPIMAMTVRFMAGLTKFLTSSEDVDGLADMVISLETSNRERMIENMHWMFETQNPSFIHKLMGNKEQIFDCSTVKLNPFDLYVLGYCIANSSTLWTVDLLVCHLTDECMKMMFLVEEGKAFHHITSLDLSVNTISTPMASLLGELFCGCC